MNKSVAYIAGKMMGDSYFLYTAFAPISQNSRAEDRHDPESVEYVLVKVGISTTPMNRLVNVGCNCPFRIAYAAFAPTFAGKRKAERIESRILKQFREYRTRGEWLMLPNTPEVKKNFSLMSRAILQGETSRPVEWTRVTGNDLAQHMLKKIC